MNNASTATHRNSPLRATKSSRPRPRKPTLTIVSSGTGPQKSQVKKSRLNQREWESKLRNAKNYTDWAQAAIALDEVSGRKRWKALDRSAHFDYAAIRKRLDHLRALRRRGDSHALVFALEEGVHGNLGGMGKPILYNRARFGTKQLINDYINTVAETLLHIESVSGNEIPGMVKLDLFKRASQCYGRSALMFSGGGALVYFHFGVAKCLLEQGLLPAVLSGSSAGAIICAVLGTRSDAELEGIFKAKRFPFGKPWQPNYFERATRLRRLMTDKDTEEIFSRMIPDLTFREAFELTGRHISISVSPTERHHGPRLLNAITSPHVLIRSAVRASCALPGFFEPVQLQARNTNGNTVPYLKSRWIDGVVAADLPAKQLARLYGINHTIVSLVNPLMLPVFRDLKLENRGLQPVLNFFKDSALSWLKTTDKFMGKYLPASSLGVANKLAHDVLSQKYQGDINIVPRSRLFSPFKLLSPLTDEEINALMQDGERQTWPRVEMIRNSSKISRTLDEILKRANQDKRGGTDG